MNIMRFRFINKNVLLVLTIIMLASCTTTRRAVGIEEGWELIAERKVNFVRDVDEVLVTSRSLFTALRFKIEDRDVRINYLKVYFENGDKLEPSIDEIINANQTSRLIELAQEGRYITKIEFKYRTIGNVAKGRANLIIFGKKFYQPQKINQ